jgi:hypothetical protein
VDRVLASEAKGRGFDPRQPHQIFLYKSIIYVPGGITLPLRQAYAIQTIGGKDMLPLPNPCHRLETSEELDVIPFDLCDAK